MDCQGWLLRRPLPETVRYERLVPWLEQAGGGVMITLDRPVRWYNDTKVLDGFPSLSRFDGVPLPQRSQPAGRPPSDNAVTAASQIAADRGRFVTGHAGRAQHGRLTAP